MHAWRLTDYAWLVVMVIMAAYFVALVAWGMWCWWLGWAASRWYDGPGGASMLCNGPNDVARVVKPWYDVRKWERREALRGT
jgi:hypothetical protein